MSSKPQATILVVDDEPANLGVLFEYLRESGYKVLVAENGRRALETAERIRPDLILLDIKLPDIDGYEVYQQLQARDLTAEMTVIFLSVLDETEYILQGFDLNAVDYITKPFQPLEVVARVDKHLVLQNLRRQLEDQNQQLQKEISERKQAEADRQNTLELMQTTLDGMNDPVVLINTDYKVMWANKAMREKYGSDQPPTSLFCYQLSHRRIEPCDPETCTCALKAVQTELAPVTVVHKHIQNDGQECQLEIVASPLFDSEGQLTGIVESHRDITDRVLATEVLRRYEEIVSASNDHMAYVDRNYVFQAVNDAYLAAHLVERTDIIGHSMAELLGDDVFTEVVQPRLNLCLAGENVRYQAWFEYSGTGRRFMDVGYSPYYDQNGDIPGVVLVARDATESKWVAETLARSERSLANSQRVAKVGHYEWKFGTDEVFMSAELYRIFGVDPAEYKPSFGRFVDLIHPDDRHLIVPDPSDSAFGLPRFEIEFRLISQDTQQVKNIYLWGETTFSETGEPELIVGTLQDISDYRQIEAALLESEELHRITIESMPDLVFITADDGEFVYIAPSIEPVTGYTVEELEQLGTIYNFISDDFFDQGELENQGEITNRETIVLTKQGEIKTFLITIKKIALQTGTTLFVLHDISDFKRAEEVLLELTAIEARRRLARDLHDSMTQSIQSLSLSAKSALYMLKNERYEALPELLNILVDGTDLAHKEMRLLLHELQVTPDEKTDLIAVLQSRLENVERRAGIEIEFQIDGRSNLSKPQEIGVYYIAQEALNNALKHAEAQCIGIYIQCRPAYLSLQVTDDGQGFPRSQTGRLDIETLSSPGMGLPNMAGRAAELGGALFLESAPGSGTTIKFEMESH